MASRVRTVKNIDLDQVGFSHLPVETPGKLLKLSKSVSLSAQWGCYTCTVGLFQELNKILFVKLSSTVLVLTHTARRKGVEKDGKVPSELYQLIQLGYKRHIYKRHMKKASMSQ